MTSNLSLPEMTPVLQRTLVGPVIGLDLLVPPDGPMPSQSGSMGNTSNHRQEVWSQPSSGHPKACASQGQPPPVTFLTYRQAHQSWAELGTKVSGSRASPECGPGEPWWDTLGNG